MGVEEELIHIIIQQYTQMYSVGRCMGANQGARVEGMAGVGLVSLNRDIGEAELEEGAEARTHE